MGVAVKCEAEYRQDECSHVLEPIDTETKKSLSENGQRNYNYRCVKCGRYLKNLNGVLQQNKKARDCHPA